MFFSNKKKEDKKKNEIDSFWLQKVNLLKIDKRFEYFKNFCKDKVVLHFGCTDWPIFDPNNNLHIQLSKYTKEIDGFDIDTEGINNLKKYVYGSYFSDFSQIENKHYDVCLIPETIEHVDNVANFLKNLSLINADRFYITAPNCFATEHINRNYNEDDAFIEIVHPDHNYWYSPYTLKNVIQKYSNLNVEKVFLMENDTMICCEATKII